MPGVADLLIVLSVTVAVLALMPMEPAIRLQGVAAPKRRPLLLRLMARVGALVPLRGRQHELKDVPVYTGSTVTLAEFSGIKVLSTLLGVFTGLVILRELPGAGPSWLILAAVVGFAAPMVWLQSRVKRRNAAIVRLLPEVFDLLSLCIGAGLDFMRALQKVVSLQKFRQEPLIQELSTTLQEIRLGKRRADALRALAKRVSLPEVSSFARTVVQAERMGTPMVEVLTVYAVDVRFQRFTRADRMALKAPLKLLVPLIFFIMPCVGIIIGAPIFLQFLRQNPFANQ